MRVVFMGTPSFSATILSYLSEQHEVVGVFTRPDTVRSRGKKLVPSPVKEVACELGIPVFECTSFSKDPGSFQALESLNPDVVVVAAFSVLLPKSVLDLPKYGCINVHASLLPRWRGAAPVERAILAGDANAGVCIMKMEEGLDTGDYCIERSMEIGNFTAEELTQELAELGSRALLTCLEHLELGSSLWVPQD
ncbi:MAG: methionyl-tRNA formyltransferase [Anaerotardibacter sp.]